MHIGLQFEYMYTKHISNNFAHKNGMTAQCNGHNIGYQSIFYSRSHRKLNAGLHKKVFICNENLTKLTIIKMFSLERDTFVQFMYIWTEDRYLVFFVFFVCFIDENSDAF